MRFYTVSISISRPWELHEYHTQSTPHFPIKYSAKLLSVEFRPMLRVRMHCSSFFLLEPFRPIRTIAGIWDVGWAWQWSWEKWKSPGWKQNQFGQTDLYCAKPDSHPATGRRRLTITGGDTRSAPYLVDDVCRAWILYCVGGGGMSIGEDRKRDRIKCTFSPRTTNVSSFIVCLLSPSYVSGVFNCRWFVDSPVLLRAQPSLHA